MPTHRSGPGWMSRDPPHFFCHSRVIKPCRSGSASEIAGMAAVTGQVGATMNTPFGATDWRSMSQAERDLGLNNSAAVTGSADIVAGWIRRSGELRVRHSAHLDLRYGPRPRNGFDFIKVAAEG